MVLGLLGIAAWQKGRFGSQRKGHGTDLGTGNGRKKSLGCPVTSKHPILHDIPDIVFPWFSKTVNPL